jgi:UDP-glucose 4-epimerase
MDNQKIKKIFITGGCGFIGTSILSYFSGRGDFEFRAYDNEVLGKRENISEFDAEFIKGDILDKEKLSTAMKGFDAVIHLAADTRVMDSIANPRFNFENNVIGSFNVLESAKNNGILRVINASTGGAILGEVEPPVHEEMMPNPLSVYGASKLAVEGLCSAFHGSYGMRTTSLRFSNVYGPRSYHKGSVVAHFFKKIIKNEPLIVYGDGGQTRDYVYSGDLCEGIYNSLISDYSGVLQLGSGQPATINELIELMKEVTCKSINVQYEEFRQGEIRHTWCNVNKAKKIIHYKPDTLLRDGLEKTWEWFKKNEGI